MRYKILISLSLILGACTAPTPVTGATTPPLLDLGEDAWITLSSGNNNDLVLTDGTHGWYTFLPHASGSKITGIETSSVTAGQAFYLRNGSTSVPIVLGHADANSAWYNRFSLPYGVDFTVPPERGVWIELWTHDGATVGWAVDTGPGIYGVTSTSAPAHAIGVAWQNTTNRPVLGLYSVRITTALSLTSGESGRVELAYGPGSGSQPTLCGRVANVSAGTLSVGVSTSNASEAQLSCVIPPGSWGILRSTNEVGSPTYSITNQLEQAL